MLSSLKLRKKQKDKIGDSKALSSIVKEPSFLKGDKSPKIVGGIHKVKQAKNQQEEFLAELSKYLWSYNEIKNGELWKYFETYFSKSFL